MHTYLHTGSKVTMDNNEKNSVKKLNNAEQNLSKAESNLNKARKDDQAATKEYEKLTSTHKDPGMREINNIHILSLSFFLALE